MGSKAQRQLQHFLDIKGKKNIGLMQESDVAKRSAVITQNCGFGMNG